MVKFFIKATENAWVKGCGVCLVFHKSNKSNWLGNNWKLLR